MKTRTVISVTPFSKTPGVGSMRAIIANMTVSLLRLCGKT